MYFESIQKLREFKLKQRGFYGGVKKVEAKDFFKNQEENEETAKDEPQEETIKVTRGRKKKEV